MEFEDALEAMGIQVRNFNAAGIADDVRRNTEDIVNKFKASLKNKARRWYQTSILADPSVMKGIAGYTIFIIFPAILDQILGV